MKSSNILENIIKAVLLEENDPRTVQLRSASEKDIATAKAAGAVAAFNIRVKGKSTISQIRKKMVYAVKSDSKVGDSSVYANPKFLYIYSDIKPNDRKQDIKVWIIKLDKPFDTNFTTFPGETDDIIQFVLDYIGYETSLGAGLDVSRAALFISKSTYEQLLKLQPYGISNTLNLNNLESEELPEDNVEISDKRTEWLNQNDTENLTFPYGWYTYGQDAKPLQYTVYKETILDNVPYLYFYDKQLDSFFVMKRVDQFLPTIIKEQMNPNFTSYTWMKLWDQIDISKVTPEENTKLQAIYQKEK